MNPQTTTIWSIRRERVGFSLRWRGVLVGHASSFEIAISCALAAGAGGMDE